MTEPTSGAPAPGTPTGSASDPGSRVDGLAFDQALTELQSVVGRLEAGGLPLESSIELYERGVELHAHCARLLTQAETRVQRLVEGAGGRLAVLDLRPDDDP